MWEIIGHQKQINYLEKDVQQSTIKHAYLLTGPEKIGKWTLVKRFARILQCEQKGCNNCTTCHHINEGIHTDTLLFKDRGETLKVEEMRDIIITTSRTFQSPYFLVCIENIERLTDGASNSFLKTLEEPPPNVLFLLTTTNINKILPTVLSRIFVLELGGVSHEELFIYMKKKYPEEEIDRIKNAINLSLDKPGLAIEMIEDRSLYDYYQRLYNDLRTLLDKGSLSEKLIYVEKLLLKAKDDSIQFQQEIKILFELLLYLLRSVFLAKMHQQAHSLLAKKSLTDVLHRMEAVMTANQLLASNINKKLVLEHLMLLL